MFRKLLMATDVSASSRPALAAAVQLAERFAADLFVVHVLPHMEGRVYKVMSGIAAKDLEEFCPVEVRSKVHREILFHDSAAVSILGFAESQHCSMIVVGSKGRGAVADLILGSTALQLCIASRIPVMLVNKHFSAELTFDRVLASCDLSPDSLHALEFAARFSNRLDAQLYILHLHSNPETFGVLQKTLQGLEFVREPVIKTSTGDPVDEILRYCQTEEIGFLIIGTGTGTGLATTSSPEMDIIRRCVIPVIAVPGLRLQEVP